jgi:hypothetical protein
VIQTHLPEAIYHERELSFRVHASTLTLDAEHDGHDPGNDRSPPLDDGDPWAIQGHQILPLPSATSDSNGPHRPTTGFNAYPVGMPPSAMPQETPSTSKAMHTDPNYISGYFAQPFAPLENPSGYWPSVPPMPQISKYGY